MELSVVYSRAVAGMDAPLVQVETHLSNGLPAFHIVGLPETAVRESKDRVRSAILNSHFTFPDRRITINLAPADLPKEGGRFDLPIALGILAASGQVPAEGLAHHEFLGELALDGSLRAVPGAIQAAGAASCSGRQLTVPAESAPLAALAPNSRVTVVQATAFVKSRRRCTSRAISPAAPIAKDDSRTARMYGAVRPSVEASAGARHSPSRRPSPSLTATAR